MRRAAALLALCLAPLNAAPASAGCLDDYVDGTPKSFGVVQLVNTVEINGYSVTVHADWVVNLATGQAGRTVTFVQCVN